MSPDEIRKSADQIRAKIEDLRKAIDAEYALLRAVQMRCPHSNKCAVGTGWHCLDCGEDD
jgi:uncharacterized coiled-coil DUF342 family protein